MTNRESKASAIRIPLPDNECGVKTSFTIRKACRCIFTIIPLRVWIMVLLVSSTIAFNVSRMNISLAVVAMTVDLHPGAESSENSSTLSTYLCPAEMDGDWLHFELPAHANVTVGNLNSDTLEVQYEEVVDDIFGLRDKVYVWSITTQGWIYGAYYWSYICCLLPGGLFASRLGSKVSIAGSLLVSALVNLNLPFVTDHILALIAMRMVLGISHGALLPSAVGMVARWIPIEEQSLCFPMIEMAMFMGSIITFGGAGWVNKELGWPGLFFVPGIIALVVCIPDLILLEDNPPSSSSQVLEIPSSPEAGKKDETVASSPSSSDDSRPPLTAILTNIPVLTCGFFKIAHNWNITIIQSNIPMYLERVTRQDVSANGYSNAGIYACMVTGLFVSGSLAGYLINNNIMSRLGCRKLMSLFSGAAVAVTLFLIPAAGCNSHILHLVLFLNSFFCGFYGGSDSTLPAEMSKKYTSFVYSLLNTMCIASSVVEPAVAGLVLDSMEDKWMAWCIVFWVGGLLTILANVIFLLGASSDRQPFDYHGEEEKDMNNK